MCGYAGSLLAGIDSRIPLNLTLIHKQSPLSSNFESTQGKTFLLRGFLTGDHLHCAFLRCSRRQ
jgi:hypothetical protein